MGVKNIIWILAIALLLLIVGCKPKSAGLTCSGDNQCVSGNCKDSICTKSNEFGGCNQNSDCADGQGTCQYGRCIRSGQGGECKINQDCKAEGNFCYLKENQITGTCMKNAFMCKSVAKYKGSLLMSILIAVVIILVLTYIFGTAVLGQTMFTIQGISISALFAIILGVISVLFMNSWFLSNCV